MSVTSNVRANSRGLEDREILFSLAVFQRRSKYSKSPQDAMQASLCRQSVIYEMTSAMTFPAVLSWKLKLRKMVCSSRVCRRVSWTDEMTDAARYEVAECSLTALRVCRKHILTRTPSIQHLSLIHSVCKLKYTPQASPIQARSDKYVWIMSSKSMVCSEWK